MKSEKESTALRDVRKWKTECWNDVADLPLEEAIEKRLHDASSVARSLGFLPEPRLTKVAAEARATYLSR